VIAGESTSGCVRATAVDARAYRYATTVVEDCVFDRTEASHALSLFDMAQKYADVRPSSSVLAQLDGAPGFATIEA
jgi:nicotinamidase-related amidase